MKKFEFQLLNIDKMVFINGGLSAPTPLQCYLAGIALMPSIGTPAFSAVYAICELCAAT